MFAVYSTQFHPVYARPAVYSAPVARPRPVYPESYMNAVSDAELYFALEQYAEQQRVMAIRRAEQKAILQEYRRRQLDAFRNSFHGRRLARAPVVGYIQLAPVQSPPSSQDRSSSEGVSLHAHGIKLYESEYEAFRRRKAQQARAEYLNQLEQEQKARNEWAEQLAASIGQTPSDLRARSLNRNINDNLTHGTPVEMPARQVKTRKIDNSDRLRKAAIHNARTRVIEELQALANEFNTKVSNSSGNDPAPVPRDPVNDVPIVSTAPPTENIVDGSEPRTEGAKLRRRREFAARAIQKHWRSRLAEVAAEKDALTTINTLRSRFEFLQSSFVAPEHLEFRQGSEKPVLLFSSDNVPVNAYTHELDKLLSLADGIPSSGNENVRSARRAFVKSVEEALEKAESLVQDIWNRQRSVSSETVSAPVSGSENAPIESTVDAAPDLDTTIDISVDTPERTVDDANASSSSSSIVINDELSLHGSSSSSSGQDATAITMSSMGDVNIAKVPEADTATSPVLADVSPNTPTSTSQSCTEANAISLSALDVGTHSSDVDSIATPVKSLSHVVSEVSLRAGAGKDDSDAFTELEHVTAFQTTGTSTPVPVTSDLINNPKPDEEELAIDHARTEEAQRGTDINIINTINGNDASPSSFPACDLDFDSTSTAISEHYECPQTNDVHAHSALLPSHEDDDDKVDFGSASTQPTAQIGMEIEISGASILVAEAGEDRNEDGHSSEDDNVISEAVAMSSQAWEQEREPETDINGALDAVQSVPVVSSSPSFPSDIIPETVSVLRENEDTASLSTTPLDQHHHLVVSHEDDEHFDVVYPDSSSSDSDGVSDVDAPRQVGSQRSEFLDVEGLEAKSSSAGSDEYELV